MIRFTSLSLRNILSVGNVTQAMRLDEPGLTLVLGQNMDDAAANSRNGVGKSSILQALSYAIYGQPLTKIRLDNLVNNVNQKGMLVTVEFERDGHKYRVERGRKPNVLRFIVDDKERGGEADEAQGENKHTQEEIERVVGLSHTLFRHLVGLSTYTPSFLKLPAAEQREVIEELLGLMQISQRAETLKKRIAATKEAIRTEDATIKATTEANARIESTLRRVEQESGAWTAAHEVRLNALLAKLEACPSEEDLTAAEGEFEAAEAWDRDSEQLRALVRTKAEEAQRVEVEATRKVTEADRERNQPPLRWTPIITRIKQDIVRLEAQIGTTQTPPQIARLQSEAARKLTEVERRAAKAEELTKDMEAVAAEIANPDAHHCTTCGQGLAGTDHLSSVMANLTAKKARLEREVQAELDAAEQAALAASAAEEEAVEVAKTAEGRKAADAERLTQLQADLSKAEDDFGVEATKAEKLAEALEIEATELVEQCDALATEQAEAEQALVILGARPRLRFPTREAIAVVRRQREGAERDLIAEDAKENPHAPQIESLKSTLVPLDYAMLNEHTDTQRHQDFLLKLLTGRDSFLRKRLIDRNLAHLNQRLAAYLDGLGLPHTVRFMPDLTVDIVYRGRDYDFDQLSRGQQGRVTLAMSFAFRDVYEGMNASLNLMFADEVIDNGMDEAGGEAALDVLRKMARERGRSVFLVSHKEGLIGRVNRLLMVRLEDGFTRIDPEGSVEVEAMAA